MKYKKIPFKKLREWFSYDPKTGVFTWLKDGSLNPALARKGSPAGRFNGRNNQLTLKGQMFTASRVAWALAHQKEFFGQIDHIDGDPTNDRLSNLRECSHAQNMYNKKTWAKSGVRGLSQLPSGNWRALVFKDGQRVSLGTFECKDMASKAIMEARKELHGAFAYDGFSDRKEINK